MVKKKICFFTGTRAEYGLLRPLMEKIKTDKGFQYQIIVSGMHLSPEFGLTYREIEKDGFRIDEKVEILLSSDTTVGISKSMGLGMISFSEAYARLKPDLLIILGDRFEAFTAAAAALIAKIPIAHINGGESTFGLIDEAIRHAITKMSLLHFASIGFYRNRIIQLGESPDRVFNVGALGIDTIRNVKLLNKAQLETELKFKFGKKTALVTFHPVTLETNTSERQFRELLSAINEFPDLKIIFTKPNADTDGRIIIKLIDAYVANNPEKAVSFVSLGQLKYLSSIKYVSVVLGNSSSGIIEVPSFGKPTINIGDRQKGRIKAESIIDCRPDKRSIIRALQKATSEHFLNFCRKVKNPYAQKDSSGKIYKIIKTNIFRLNALKKKFYDLKTER